MAEIDPALFEENERSIPSDDAEIASLGPLVTQSGFEIPSLEIAWQGFGEFDPQNAILICHALTGNANVIRWWDRLVGPGKAIDTNRYFVVGNNLLGGCNGTTGPSSIAPDGKPWGSRFPIITTLDQVRAQLLLLQYLGIEKCLAVIGPSTGGFLALQWAVQYPKYMERFITIASAPRQTAFQIALNEVGRQAIMRDPKWKGGDYDLKNPPVDGLAVARMIGHIGYLSETALQSKFDRNLQDKSSYEYTLRPEFQVESYLNYQGEKFTQRFDANSYLILTRAANYFNITTLENAKAKALFISFESDRLYPSDCGDELDKLAKNAHLESAHFISRAPFGHDSFLLDDIEQAQAIKEFLEK